MSPATLAAWQILSVVGAVNFNQSRIRVRVHEVEHHLPSFRRCGKIVPSHAPQRFHRRHAPSCSAGLRNELSVSQSRSLHHNPEADPET